MRSAQQIYETVVKHQRKQGQKSHLKLSDGNYSCRYRDPEGRKCAIGCLIPDIEYVKEMEGKDVGDLISGNLLNLLRSAEFYRHRKLLDGLQKIHDKANSFDEWERQWRMLADDMQLKYPKP